MSKGLCEVLIVLQDETHVWVEKEKQCRKRVSGSKVLEGPERKREFVG